MSPGFWRGRRVFVTGHTGFKGSWLSAWLTMLGAEVTGFSLPDDVRDLSLLRTAMNAASPEIVFHLAAQTLVRMSHEDPVLTFSTNLQGTVHVLEVLRGLTTARVAVFITSDKCYANSHQPHSFREDDRLGGDDPYSASKAGAELAVAAYRASFFASPHAPRVFTARAGNVIGGGDWSRDRLVPDLIRAFQRGEKAQIRYPDATRPWQFVLDALHGYLLVAEHGWESGRLSHAFNFGPEGQESRSVRWLADRVASTWGDDASWIQLDAPRIVESPFLALDSSRAREELGWRPVLDADALVRWSVDWYKGATDKTEQQLKRFSEMIAP